jgi:hypothetical protein
MSGLEETFCAGKALDMESGLEDIVPLKFRDRIRGYHNWTERTIRLLEDQGKFRNALVTQFKACNKLRSDDDPDIPKVEFEFGQDGRIRGINFGSHP